MITPREFRTFQSYERCIYLDCVLWNKVSGLAGTEAASVGSVEPCCHHIILSLQDPRHISFEDVGALLGVTPEQAEARAGMMMGER